MNWTVEYDEAFWIIVDTYIGRCSGQDFKDDATKRIALGVQKGTAKTLVDVSNLEVEPSTTLDLYNIVEHMYNEEGNRAGWTMAITTPGSAVAREQVHFFVTLCKNRGWKIEDFAERKDALAWLIEQNPSS